MQDPGEAFFAVFTHIVADAATKIALGEALFAAGGVNDGDVAAASTQLRRTVGALLERAQAAGAVREDVELPEVYALLVGTSRAVTYVGLDGEIRDRMLIVVFDGLAAPT